MGLLSLFQRKARQPTSGAPARSSVDPAAAAEAVREARTRARRRLMGATVLLLVGIIGFPLLFETRPRPIPVDLPIEIPARTGASALPDATPAPRVNRLATPINTGDSSTTPSSGAAPASSPPPMLTESAPAAPVANPAARAASVVPAPAHPVQFTASTPAAASRAVAAVVAASAAAKPAASKAVTVTVAVAASAAPADKPNDAAADSGHFVVQIGAFAEQPKAHEARMKVEKLGLKTYVQVVDTPQGKRIRVRVGPYATKAEADKAATKIKGDGLPAAVLQL